MFNILLFEDAQVAQMRPITTGRPGFGIRVATYTLFDLIVRWEANFSAYVRPHLRPLVEADYAPLKTEPGPEHHTWTLLINSRVVPGLENLEAVKKLTEYRDAVVIRNGARIVAAWLPTSRLENLSYSASMAEFSERMESCVSGIQEVLVSIDLIEYPHDVIRFNLQLFNSNLNDRIAKGEYREISDGVFASPSAKISDFVVTNSRTGPIVIERDTVIGPFCFLRGPVFIGANSRINEHSSIKDSVYIGNTAKIGGEVEGSIVESYSNKQHHGFLGHSFLGSWINLGAGTCNSDLKNTYGEVKMDYLGQKIATGMQFVGCFIGDYAKTAINTSIFTGKTVGVCSMVYGFVTTNVPSFVNYARSFSQVTETPPSVMEATQRRMFHRRNVEQRPIDIQLLSDMYELTRRERQMSEEPLSL